MPAKHLKTAVLSAVALIVLGAVALVEHRQSAARKASRIAAAAVPEAANEPEPRWRLISLMPSLTETVFMLGLGDCLIARSQYCDFPPSVTNLPVVGSYGNANIEAITRLKPDFVLMPDLDSQSWIHDALAEFRINHLGYSAISLNDIIGTVWDLGKRFEAEEQSVSWIAHIEKLLGEAAAAAPETAPKILFCAGREPGSLDRIFIAGKGNFYSDIVIKCGGVNAYEGGLHSPMISAEGVMLMNPDIIVDVLVGSSKTDVRKAIDDWSRLTAVNAVKTADVHILTDSWAVRPGPRIGILIETAAEYIKEWAEKK